MSRAVTLITRRSAAESSVACRWLLAALLGGAWSGAAAQANPQPLFADHEPLRLVIEAPISTLVRRKEQEPEVNGVVRYRDDAGADVALQVKISTRGRSRLRYCDFPPLRLNFKRKQVRDTLFASQNKLKLVVHCKRGNKHAQWVHQEYLIYRLYNALTDQSFRVRWLTVEYRDTKRPGQADPEVGFLIESPSNVAKRLGLVRVERPTIDPGRLDSAQATLAALFQFMIGNTDWSVLTGHQGDACCHNGRPMRESGATSGYIVVPYDFDQAGFVDTDYALPSASLNIRSVRTRVFRGLCMHNDQLDATIKHFNDRRTSVEELIGAALVSDWTRRKMQTYVKEFYAVVNDPGKMNNRIIRRCRG